MPRPHRYVTEEPHIPFEMDVLYEDERIIVVDKPHFLPTMPRGMWYRSTALMRLRERLGEPDITPAHRLDRLTAGVLVFVRDPACRGAYQMLFQNRRAVKVYECLAPCRPIRRPRFGTVTWPESPRPFPLLRRSHITKERGTLTAFEEPGIVNAETLIERGPLAGLAGAGGLFGRPLPGLLLGASASSGASESSESSVVSGNDRRSGHGDDLRDDLKNGVHGGGFASLQSGGFASLQSSQSSCAALVCRYTLHPRTGKTHQLRVHMNSLGLPIVGDDFYPRIQTRPYDDFSQPLELVARTLRFMDPITGEPREFISRIPLGG